jgi:hypothetical protein
MSIKTLSPRLQGRKDFTISQLWAVADAVGVQAQDLLGDRVVA